MVGGMHILGSEEECAVLAIVSNYKNDWLEDQFRGWKFREGKTFHEYLEEEHFENSFINRFVLYAVACSLIWDEVDPNQTNRPRVIRIKNRRNIHPAVAIYDLHDLSTHKKRTEILLSL